MFHGHIQVVKKPNNSVVEVLENLELVCKVARKNENFVFFTVTRLLAEKRAEGYEDECNYFLTVAKLYGKCLEYLCKWLKSMEEFACFK